MDRKEKLDAFAVIVLLIMGCLLFIDYYGGAYGMLFFGVDINLSFLTKWADEYNRTMNWLDLMIMLLFVFCVGILLRSDAFDDKDDRKKEEN